LRDYELVYIVSPQVAEENLSKVVDKVSQFIVARGGQVDKVDSWGKRRLAYAIGPFKEGSYFLTYFKLDAPQAQDLENSLRTTEDIIRHLVVRLDEEQVRQMQERQLQQQQQQQRLEQQQQQQQQLEQAQPVEEQQAPEQQPAQLEQAQPVEEQQTPEQQPAQLEQAQLVEELPTPEQQEEQEKGSPATSQ